MTFQLFGVDILPYLKCFGFWVGNIIWYDREEEHKSLFGIYYLECDIYLDILYMRIIL